MAIAALMLTFRTLLTGSYATLQEPKPVMLVARDAVAMRNIVNAYVGNGDVPAVDFAKESAIFLFAGRKNTGGWSLAVKSVKADDKCTIVDAAIKPPPPDSFVTQAITSPFVVIAVAKPAIDGVRWMDGDRPVDTGNPEK